MRLRNLLFPYYPIRDRLLGLWARRYLSKLNIRKGSASELPPKAIDLALLHRAIITRRPKVVLEFGVGFSTIIMGQALKQVGGHLWTVDASKEWLENTRAKLTDEPVTLIHSAVQVTGMCHRYVELPDIVPDMINLDGPDKSDIPGWDGPPISADVLHYLPRLQPGCLLVIDGRFTNVEYLKSMCGSRWEWRRDDRLRRTEAVLKSVGAT